MAHTPAPIARALAGAWLAFLALGCGAPKRPSDARGGWDTAGRAKPSSEPSPPPRRWPHAEQLRALTSLGGGFRTQHLDGTYEAQVQSTPDAVGERPPPGAVMAEALTIPGATRVAAYLTMRRNERGGWDYGIIDADGWILPGSLDLCARCHAEAPYGGLFGKYSRAP